MAHARNDPALKLTVLPTLNNEEDVKRHRYILNILLLGSSVLTAIGLLIVINDLIHGADASNGLSPYILVGTLAFFVFLLGLSQTRYQIVAAYLFLATFYALGSYTSFRWGTQPAVPWLVYVLVITMAAVLVGTRFTVTATIIITLTLSLVSYLYDHGRIGYDLSWQGQPKGEDLIPLLFILGIIALISWLSNREIERSLVRARISEAALKNERDLLESKVEERTREVRQAQLEKIQQLYRFVELGRITSGVIHDLTNPLTTVSLGLEELKSRPRGRLASPQLSQAIRATQQMQRFIGVAKRQVQQQEIKTIFRIDNEIKDALAILTYKAKQQHVELVFTADQACDNYGDPIKFQQVVTNLVSNAIDAYDEIKVAKNRLQVVVSVEPTPSGTNLIVQDWGAGISEKDREHIFEPLFTTKSPEKGMGIGLSITKSIVEQDFHGKIQVQSESGKGTTFRVSFPRRDV